MTTFEEAIEIYLTTNSFEDLKDYEGYYKINRNGHVWSVLHKIEMKPQMQIGYLWLKLTKDGVRHKGYIHRLLGIQYIENPNNLPEIDHIDRNRTNNTLENLRWIDKKGQMNNKSNNLALKTEDELKQREDDIRAYKREWAKNNRREKGIEPRKQGYDRKKHSREYMRAKRANMTDDEKQAYLKERRENRPEQTEEQKARAIERAKAQRERIKADPERAAKYREYSKLKARESYKKK